MVVTNISYEFDRLGQNNPDPHHPHLLLASRSAVCISSSVANAAAYTKLLTADHKHRYHHILRHFFLTVLSPDFPENFSDNIPPLVISNLYAQSAFVDCAREGNRVII